MERQYDYRPKWTLIILCGMFFGACALVFVTKANGNDRGLKINGIVELSAAGATVVYWVLAAGSMSFVILAVFLAIVRITVHQQIVLTETSITIPRSRWSSEVITVPFGAIVEMSASRVSGQRLLKIAYNGGKFTLNASLLPRKGDFDDICLALVQGVKAAPAIAR